MVGSVAPAQPFELAAPARIVFGAGTVAGLGALAREHGGHALLVTGRSTARATAAAQLLEEAGVRVTSFAVAGEPSVETARAGVAAARAAGCDLVVGFGGGSALDAAKAIAALLGNGGDPLDYLEVVGRGRPLMRPSFPFIAVPTTAGTGSEVTKNAVLASSEQGVKASLRSPLMLARVAIVDPDLLDGLPAPVVASSGLDALSQLVEPFLSARANPFSDGLAREGISRSAGALGRAYAAARAGRLVAAADREALALASLFGGLCLANAGLGAVHGFAAPIGGLFAAPHGAVCAALLVPVLRVNLAALRARAAGGATHGRFAELAALLTGRPQATAEDGIAFLIELCRALEVPGLARYGVSSADVPTLVAKARVASSMKGNPVALTDDELAAIVVSAL